MNIPERDGAAAMRFVKKFVAEELRVEAAAAFLNELEAVRKETEATCSN